MIIFCDIDGVIADIRHRLHFKDEGDYDAFYADDNLAKDELNRKGMATLTMLVGLDQVETSLTFITGRPERTRSATERWLAKNLPDGLAYRCHSLRMRQDGDYRKSAVVKAELAKEILIEYGWLSWDGELLFTTDSILFIDDDPTNVKAVCEELPSIIGLTFGTKRFDELVKEANARPEKLSREKVDEV